MKKQSRLLAALLALLVLLSACGSQQEAEKQDDPAETEQTETAAVTQRQEHWGAFTMLYNPENPVNPYTSSDPDNLLLSQLLYEGLFVLDGSFAPQPVLCEKSETDDGITHTFTLKKGVTFADGSPLTAADAVYSVNCARNSRRFGKRLSAIEYCYEGDEELTFVITLDEANRLFPALLDIPVVKTDTGDQPVPVGTGPYTLTGKTALVANSSYRTAMPLGRIALRTLDTSYSEAFNTGALDLAVDPVCGEGGQVYYGSSESRYYDTTILEYVGFNTDNVFFEHAEIRAGVAALIDRQTVAGEDFLTRALPATGVYSSAWAEYDVAWSLGAAKGETTLKNAFTKLGVADLDKDGVLEMPGTAEEARYMLEFSVDFIVNEENPFKVQAAQRIAEAMREQGILVEVRALSWDAYLTALNTRDFDLYYGEAMLTADFDLSPLLLPGGSLNYGDFAGEGYWELLAAMKSADSADARRQAGSAVVAAVQRDAPFAAVLYRKYAAVMSRNRVTNAEPTQSSIFYNYASWEIK